MADLAGFDTKATKQLTAQLRLKGGLNIATISADATFTAKSGNYQAINGGTTDRTITMETEAASEGLIAHFVNKGVTNLLTIVDDAAATIVVLRPGEQALIMCSSSAWSTIAHGFDVPALQYHHHPYNAPADSIIGVMHTACRVVAIYVRPRVVGSDGGTVTAQIRKAPSGTAPASGTILHSSTADLKGTVDTNQSLTLTATAADLDLAAGDALCMDVTGTTTAATGVVTVVTIPK